MTAQLRKSEIFGMSWLAPLLSFRKLSSHPSELDYTKMSDIYRMSAHELGGMLLVIVGKAQFPAGLFVGGVSGSGVISLAPMSHA